MEREYLKESIVQVKKIMVCKIMNEVPIVLAVSKYEVFQ